MSVASATTYRCEVDGKILYSDAPCRGSVLTGTVASETPVSSEDRAAAAARLRADKATLAASDRRHEQERLQDQRVEALAAKRGNRDTKPCARLAVRAKRAHEDYDLAAPAIRSKTRLRMQRAEADFAALCKR